MKSAGAKASAPALGHAHELLGLKVGNYVIERALARGGMATVYAARHPTLGREVAVKFLAPEYQQNTQLAQRFLQEAQITATIRHRHVIEILDFGDLNGRAYYTMELLRGRDLASELEARRFSWPEVTGYLTQVCAALEAAHALGVVHRDLKPANVFVLDQEPLCLKLMDFGVAKVQQVSGGATRHGQILGTPTHMAPEQALGQSDRISAQTDLYALGVIAFEMLTGQLPFVSDSDVLLMTMHIKDPVPRLCELAPEVPAAVGQVIESCLAKDPKQRPSSARQLAARLAAASASQRSARALPSAANHSPALEQRRSALLAPTIANGQLPELAQPVGPAQRSFETARQPRPHSGRQPLHDEAVASSRRNGAPRSGPNPAAGDVGRVLAAETPPPLPSERSDENRASGEALALSEADGKALARLLRRIQARGDLPSFINNMPEISMKADANSRFSAGQLSQAILKDYALTAKLLRIVNQNFVNNFGGKVFSVNQAVVILGFDSVRSIAMGVSVYKMPGAKGGNHKVVASPFGDQLAESAINALVSGEIARLLAGACELAKDAELAMMCAMFRNLGEHLVMQYLAEDYQQILSLTATGVPLVEASTRILGLSFPRISLGVAEEWRLPKRLRAAISCQPAADSKLERVEDRLSALAKFATDFTEIVAGGTRDTWFKSLERLAGRNQQLLSLSEKELSALLGVVCKAFEERYSSLFGRHSQKSRFLKNARTLTGDDTASVEATPPPLGDAERRAIEQATKELSDGLAKRSDVGRLLDRGLEALLQALNVPHVVLLRQTQDRKQLVVAAATGDDVTALRAEFKVPIARSADLLCTALHTGKNVVIEDTLGPAAARRLPQCYYELIGSPTLQLLPCTSMGYPSALLLVDTDFPERLPQEDRILATKALRELFAKLVSRVP